MTQTGRSSRYEVARAEISELVESENFRSGHQLDSENTLANRLGVSRPLVRRALKELVQQGKVISRPGKGHFVASAGSCAAPGVVSVIAAWFVDTTPWYTDPYIHGVFGAVNNSFANTPFRPVLEWMGRAHRSVSDIVKPQLPDLRGAVLVPLGDQSGESMAECLPAGIPYVIAGRPVKKSGTPCVYVDHAGGIKKAIQYLANQGHRQIRALAIAGAEGVAYERECVYREEMRRRGLELDDKSVGYIAVTNGSQVNQMVLSYLRSTKGRMSALIILDSRSFQWSIILRAIMSEGLVFPKDFSLICVDDTVELQHNIPPVSVVRQPEADMGRIAAEMLLTLLSGKSLELTEIILSTELIVRDSCMAL